MSRGDILVQSNAKRKRVNDTDTDNTSSLSTVNDEYFASYSCLDVHITMLEDKQRTHSYRLALMKSFEQIYRCTAADVGCGTGILSCFLCQAGASKVYAMDASIGITAIAEQLVKDNKCSDRISILKSAAEDVQLNESVDVIVSEWMGYCLLYENMLPSVLKFRDRFLRPCGLMFPNSAKLFVAGYSSHLHHCSIDNNDSIGGCSSPNCLDLSLDQTYEVNLDSVRSAYAKSSSSKILIANIDDCRHIVTSSSCLFTLQLSTISVETINDGLSGDFDLSVYGDVKLDGLCLWFDVGFPSEVTLSTSPYGVPTHWQQTLVLFDTSYSLNQTSSVSGSISLITPPDSRDLQVSVVLVISGEQVENKTVLLSHLS